MSRPLQIEFTGAVDHVTSRGDRREATFVDHADRIVLLALPGRGMARVDAQALVHCLPPISLASASEKRVVQASGSRPQ